MSQPCQHLEEIASMRRSELRGALREHAESCLPCRRALEELEALLATTRRATDEAMSPARSERLRVRLLDSARRTPRPGPTRAPIVVGALAALAVAAALFWIVRGPATPLASTRVDPAVVATSTPSMPAEPSLRGTVRASTGAHFTRLSDAPDEIVRLVEGSVSVTVSPLREGERFRVVVGDAEVEVRGTAFEVAAHDDRLESVDVLHGRVEVRTDGHEAVILEAGDRWTRVAETAATTEMREETDLAITQAHRRTAPRARATEPSEAPPASETWTAATGFETGWNALSAGDPEAAATAFGDLIARAPHDALAEDASFWRAVALSRAGRTQHAEAALDDFVRDYPTSVRADEAAVMLGWLLVARGEPERARAMFTRGADDPSARVRASAERGLAAIPDDSP